MWAAIPESDPQVLDLLTGSQVSVPVLVHAQGYMCELGSVTTMHSLKPEVLIACLGHFFDPLQPCDLAFNLSQ